MRKLQPQEYRDQELKKNKPSNATKADSETSKTFLVCSSVAIRAKR
jgi:hypothetical protein